MSVLVFFIAILTISELLESAVARKWVQSNPQGNFAMGVSHGYINVGDYEVIVPNGNDEVKREILIKGQKVEDSVDMVFNSNTMVFSNWDGWFKLDKAVYTDTPGVLYFMRSDGKCDRKHYEKLGDEIRAISRDPVDASICQTLKAKVDAKMNHFLEFPFKYLLPKADLELRSKQGFPGGEYYEGIVTGDVYVCQHQVKIPPGDSDKEKEVEVSAPGVKTKITMKVDSHTQIFGKWDGSFYLGDKVYTNEPRVLYIDDNKGGCLKKVFKDYGTAVDVAYDKLLQANECFIIKNKIYNDMQKLIADPKLLADEEKLKQPLQNPPPITVTSTVVFPKHDQNGPTSTLSTAQHSTHTITLSPGVTENVPGYNANTGNTPAYGQGNSASNVHPNTAGSNPPSYGLLSQQQSPPVSGMSSNVHISSVTSDHPAYPSVTATSVTQSLNSEQQPSTISQPQAAIVSQGQPAVISPQIITLVQQNTAVPSHQVIASPTGGMQVVVPPGSSTQGNTVVLQPVSPLSSSSLSNQALPTSQNNDLKVSSHNVNIQSDGTFNVDGRSVILQGLPPNTELVTPEGNVIRVTRSPKPDIQQTGNFPTFHTVTLTNQGNNPPVVTLTGNGPSSAGNLATVQAIPPNPPQIQHTTTVNVQGTTAPEDQKYHGGSLVPSSVSTNLVVTSNQKQPAAKLYFLKTQPPNNNENYNPTFNSNGPLVVEFSKPTPAPTVVTLQTQSLSQNIPNSRGTNGNDNLNTNSQNPNLVLTTSPQGNTISMNHDKPLVLNLQSPNGVQQLEDPGSVNLNLGSSGGSVLINTKNAQQQSSHNKYENSKKQVNGVNRKEHSDFNLMRDLNLPTPVNNLIVNIAENMDVRSNNKK